MRLAVGTIAFVTLSAGWIACVGDDPTSSSGPAVGDRLGACFPDGKCKEGLECRDGEICLRKDEPKPLPDGGSVPADSGSGTIDSGGVVDGGGGGDAAGDGAVDGGACKLPSETTHMVCPNQNCSAGVSEGCCASAASFICAQDTECEQAGESFFSCNGPAVCGANYDCCLAPSANLSMPVPTACSGAFRAAKSLCYPQGTCPAGHKKLCTKDGDCDGQKCTPFEVHVDAYPMPIVWGFCP
jgi:hypothetical protein